MTVGELIAKLQEFDQNMMVVVDGYEGGVEDVEFVQTTDIALNFNANTWYYGKHEPVTDDYLTDEEKEKHTVVTAVYLPR
jgi:hypothetical protein